MVDARTALGAACIQDQLFAVGGQVCYCLLFAATTCAAAAQHSALQAARFEQVTVGQGVRYDDSGPSSCERRTSTCGMSMPKRTWL